MGIVKGTTRRLLCTRVAKLAPVSRLLSMEGVLLLKWTGIFPFIFSQERLLPMPAAPDDRLLAAKLPNAYPDLAGGMPGADAHGLLLVTELRVRRTTAMITPRTTAMITPHGSDDRSLLNLPPYFAYIVCLSVTIGCAFLVAVK